MSPPKSDPVSTESSVNNKSSDYPPTVVCNLSERSSNMNFLSNFYAGSNPDEKKVTAPTNISSGPSSAPNSTIPSVIPSKSPSNTPSTIPSVVPSKAPSIAPSKPTSSDQGVSPDGSEDEKSPPLTQEEILTQEIKELRQKVRTLEREKHALRMKWLDACQASSKNTMIRANLESEKFRSLNENSKKVIAESRTYRESRGIK